MINTDKLLEAINNTYKHLPTTTERIHQLAEDVDITARGLYKIIRTKKCSLETLIFLKSILNFSYDDVIESI